MRITPAGAGTVFSSAIPNGRIVVPGAYLQTGLDQAVQLNAAADWAAQKICPGTDWELNALAWYVAAVATGGNAAIKLFSDDGATDGIPDSAIHTLYNAFGSGDTPDVWNWDDGFTPYQLQRGKTYWLVFQGADGADFSLSGRRWNTNVGSMFPDEMPAAKISTDGGSSWSAFTQDSKPAILNIVLNASANIVPPLIYGRYNGQYIYLPGTGIREIPEAGVSLACDALTADTLYYVYIYDSSGTLTLEPSATAPTLSEGILVKTGATTHRLVGWVYPKELQSGSQGPIDVMDSRLVLNLYNPEQKTFGKLNPYSGGNTGDVPTEDTWERWNDGIDWKIEALFSGAEKVFLSPFAHCSVTSNVIDTAVGMDTESTPDLDDGNPVTMIPGATGSTGFLWQKKPSPGYHYFYPFVKTYGVGDIKFLYDGADQHRRSSLTGFIWGM